MKALHCSTLRRDVGDRQKGSCDRGHMRIQKCVRVPFIDIYFRIEIQIFRILIWEILFVLDESSVVCCSRVVKFSFFLKSQHTVLNCDERKPKKQRSQRCQEQPTRNTSTPFVRRCDHFSSHIKPRSNSLWRTGDVDGGLACDGRRRRRRRRRRSSCTSPVCTCERQDLTSWKSSSYRR